MGPSPWDDAAFRLADYQLSPRHPVWSLVTLLDSFGSLIFPIHRAALLRKRILISCRAPVRPACEFVYDLSVLSNIPRSGCASLPPASVARRLRPLFSLGVHIPLLLQHAEASRRRRHGQADQGDDNAGGWVACTTDSILAVKDALWDMLITMSPDQAPGVAAADAWPVVESPRGRPVKATQRDLRRYQALRSGLARLDAPDRPVSVTPAPRPVEHEPPARLVEPASWTSLAYTGYLWWASAGEQLRSDAQQESARDAALLAGLAAGPWPRTRSSPGLDPLADSVASFADRHPSDAGRGRVELAIIAYFHRLTTQMLAELAAAMARAAPDESGSDSGSDSGSHDTDDAPILDCRDSAAVVDSLCMESMGLDVWSAADAAFVRDLAAAYLGRDARVEPPGVDVCGLRVC